MKRPQSLIILRRAFVALWLASIAAPGVPVLCVGATGHAAFEFEETSCCLPGGAAAGAELAPASAGDDCVDCSDFLVARESTPGRRDPSVSGAAPPHDSAAFQRTATRPVCMVIRPPSAARRTPAFHLSLPTTIIRR